MAFDIKKIIEDLIAKIKKDPKAVEEFKKSPIETVEKLAGVDIPDEQISAVVEGVKAKISLDDIGEKLGGLKNILG